MARWLVFASWKADDSALWNSHWIAQQTARIAPVPPALIEREQAIREALEAALADAELEGVALFGHGRPHAVLGADGREALDTVNVRLIGAR